MPEIVPNLHPIFVHFTVALLLLSVVLCLASTLIAGSLHWEWRITARWMLWLGAGFAIVTGLSGLYAYNTVAHDSVSHLAMTTHRNWALATILLFVILAAWSIYRTRQGSGVGKVFLLLMVIGAGLLTTTAWHGGEIVYRYGLGVMSLPKSEAHGHSHDPGHVHDDATHSHAEHAHVDDDHAHTNEHHEQMPVEGNMDFSGMDNFDDASETALPAEGIDPQH